MKKTTLFILVSVFCYPVFAQKSKSSKAEKLYQESDVLLNRQLFPEAINVLKKAVEYDSEFIDAYIRMSDIYLVLRQYDSAKIQLQKINKPGDAYLRRIYFNSADAEMGIGNYDKAIPYFEKLTTLPGVSNNQKTQAQINLSRAIIASDLTKHPVPFNPINLGDSINSPFAEYLPSVTADEQTIIFTRKITDPSGRQNEDFYFSKKNAEGEWRKVRNLGPPINTSLNEGAQTISPDGKTIYYTVCNAPDGYGSCDIYFTRKDGNRWTAPVNIGPPINTGSFESQPSISSDGQSLYFLSNRKGSLGGIDIYVSYRDQTTGKWNEPINLGSEVNTKENEYSPFIHPDNVTLYFASLGHPGLGDADLFLVRKDDKGKWGNLKNLGYPINSSKTESSLIVSTNGERAYFASDRSDTRGQLDLYYFDLYAEARPSPVTFVKGTVIDAKNHGVIESTVELIDLETGKLFNETQSDKTNGEFLICLPSGKNYALNISKKGYLFYSENFSLKEYNSEKPYLMNIPLQPINVGESVVLKNIFFETDSYRLKEESKTELGKLISFLKENPSVKILISGHTDNVGKADYNLKLSENRAKSVNDYLVAGQIAKERLNYKGFGMTKPIASNDTPDGKAKNRRTEFTVTEK